MMELNKNDKERQRILGIEGNDYSMGGTTRIRELTLAQLDELLEKNFADPEDAQNNAPTFQEIRDFIAAHPDFVAHGYAVSPERYDYRVSLEGIKLDRKPTEEELRDFVNFFRYADEFECEEDGCYAWYD